MCLEDCYLSRCKLGYSYSKGYMLRKNNYEHSYPNATRFSYSTRALWNNCINCGLCFTQCEKQCAPNCVERVYEFKVVEKSDTNNGFIDVVIAHNRLPDKIFEHIPEMTWITFVSEFGGLLGMWLVLHSFIFYSNWSKLHCIVKCARRKLFIESRTKNNTILFIRTIYLSNVNQDMIPVKNDHENVSSLSIQNHNYEARIFLESII